MNDPWLTVPGEQPEGTGTLAVCFAPTGAHGSTFAGWRGRLPEDITLAFVAPPGRGTRVDEEPVTDMAVYADAAAAGIRELLGGRRLVLIGVSLGALLAYETCHRCSMPGCPSRGSAPWPDSAPATSTAGART